MPVPLPYFLLGVVVCSLVAAAISSQRSTLKLSRRSWADLVATIHRVNFDDVKTVARDYLDPHRGQTELEPEKIWQLVGGQEGLKMMRENAKIMLALAAYAQQWNFEEGVIVTERMRRDALRLRGAVNRIEFGLISHTLLRRFWISVPFHVCEAASAYYLMRQRLLALYETSHAGLYPALAATL